MHEWTAVRCLALAIAMAAGGGGAEATCSAERRISSRYSYVYTPGIQNGYLDSTITGDFLGSFWALDAGHPTVGAGIDNGKLAAVQGNFDGWLTIDPRVGQYGYPPVIDTAWNASPLIDGCIDTTGSDPVEPDLQQCVVALFADQHAGQGYFAIATAPADTAGDYDLTVPGDQPLVLAAIPTPQTDFDPYLTDPVNAIVVDPPLLGDDGQYVHPDCADVIDGYRVYTQVVPPGSAPPVDRTREDGPGGWEVAPGGQLPTGRPLPLGVAARLSLRCAVRSDVYLAYSLVFDGGFETPYLSANQLPFAIDCCTDADADGLCAEPGENRDTDCDDANAHCTLDCTDADQDGYCVPGDCADGDPVTHLGVAETCDGLDNNCDGRADELPVPLGSVTATGVVADARFGGALAGLGDLDQDGYPDFAVGAAADEAGGVAGAGSVTLYSGRTRSPIVRLVHPDPAPGDEFGAALARLADVNFDGFDELLVGAPGDDTSRGVDAGSAFVISGSTADVFPVLHVLEDPAGATGDRFGATLAALDDHDQDGIGDLAVAAPEADAARGRVTVFSSAGGLVVRTLAGEGGLPGDRFGCAVARVADFDTSSADDLAIGACGADSPVAAGAGVAFLLRSDTWTFVGTLFDPLGLDSDAFGHTLVGLDDLDGDGLAEILAGAPSAAGGDGAAWVFPSTTPGQPLALAGPAPDSAAAFGSTAARVDDLDGDTTRDLVVAAPADGGGSVYVFSGATGAPIVRLAPDALGPGSAYGAALGTVGDLDDDGVGEVMIGAPMAEREAATTGDAWVVRGAGTADRDGDGAGDACDCAPEDPTAQAVPGPVQAVVLTGATPTALNWADPGPGHRFDVAGGLLSELRSAGIDSATCVVFDAPAPPVLDGRPAPPSGDGYYYLPRARNACGSGGYGVDSEGAPRDPGSACD